MRIGIDASRAFVNQRTGTERYAYELITRILKLPEAKKHEWVIYTRGSYTTSPLTPLLNSGEGNKRGEVSIKEVNIKIPYLWTQIGLAYRTWRDNLDLLWVPAHTLPLLRQPSWLRKGRPLRTVVTIHGIEYEWLPAYENWLQRWYLPLSTIYAVKTASKVIAVSKFTKRQLIERLGADERKIEVVYEGFSTSPSFPLLNSGEGRKGEVLKRFGLKAKKYLLFVGTVQPRKNLERLIEAFLALPFDCAQGDKPKLVIAGKLGWGYEKVVELANRSGGRVVLTGYITDKERAGLLAGALAYVQPSITEGFGLPVLEAMAAGVPVVSSSGGALQEILQITNYKSQITKKLQNAGLVFDPLDTNDIAEKIRRIIEDKELRKKLIKFGKIRAGDFSWQKAALETYNILVK